MMVCSEIKLQIDNPWLGGGKVQLKRCEEEFIRSPLLLLSKQGQSDRSDTSLEAVTAPFLIGEMWVRGKSGYLG